jgi:hypothetical protein
MMPRAIVLHLLQLAEDKAEELSRAYRYAKSTCGAEDPHVLHYLQQIHENNQAIVALKNEGTH